MSTFVRFSYLIYLSPNCLTLCSVVSGDYVLVRFGSDAIEHTTKCSSHVIVRMKCGVNGLRITSEP